MKYSVCSVLILLSLSSVTWSEKRAPELNDVFRIKEIDKPDISADGKKVVYSVHELHFKTNKSSTNIWLLSLDKKKPKALTHDNDTNNSLPKWSPNGLLIAYLSDADDLGTQLYVYSLKDKKTHQMTHIHADISDFCWSPDSKEIAFIARMGTQDSDENQEKPIVINRYLFKEDTGGYLTGSRNHLYLLNLEQEKITSLSSGNHDEYAPSWSPNGEYIAYVSKRGKDPDRSLDYHIFLIKPHLPASERQLTHFYSNIMEADIDSSISWSPDSAQIVYLGAHEGKWAYYAPYHLIVVTLANTQERLISSADKWFYRPKWSTNKKTIYALVEENCTIYLNAINPVTGVMQQLTNGLRSDKDFAVAKNKIVVLSTDDTHPAELFLLNSGKLSLITDHNHTLLEEVDFQSAKDFHFKIKNGPMIDGLLMKSALHQAGKNTPGILYLHGGPVDQFTHAFDFDLQWFAAHGYTVIAPNPRGSSGKGFDFAKAIYADWGNLDVKDTLDAVDYIVAQDLVDPKRLAVGGWSYGGMLTNYIIASDGRFKAALSGAGSANILSNYGVDQYTHDYESELGKPWITPERYLKLSYPFLKSDHIKTPTLFMCGQLDFNVPCEGSEQLYQALKSLNIPTQLVIYPQTHHNIEIPSYIADRLKRYIVWLDKYNPI